jgi:hypothetical protein
MVSFTLRPENNTWLPLYRRLCRPQSQSGPCGEEIHLLMRKRRIEKSRKILRRKMIRGRKRITTRRGDDKEEEKEYKNKDEKMEDAKEE